LLGAVACGPADVEITSEADQLHTLLSVERTEAAGQEELLSASAMAQFVSLPVDADADDALELIGVGARIPGPDECFTSPGEASGASRGATARAEFDRVELLAAGDVTIRVGDEVTHLALNLVPFSGSASGVLYATRDRAAAPLRPGANYVIDVTGSEYVQPMTLDGAAPPALQNVTVGGVPLDEEILVLNPGEPLDLTWAEGEAGDRVYAHVLGESSSSVICTFRDDAGSGTIPGERTAALLSDTAARISLHRMREISVNQTPYLRTLVRFDFEVTSILRVD
jgi:hypothetical protein